MARNPQTNNRMQARIYIVLVLIAVIGFGILIGRLYHLQINEGEKYQTLALKQQLRPTEITAQRGTIYDRNRKTLAASATVWTVTISPAELENADQLDLIADYLSELGEAIGFAYLEGQESVDESRGKYYNPERARKLGGVPDIVKKGREAIRENYNFPIRVRTASMRVLEYHAEYAERLAKALTLKADGNDAEASKIMKTELFPLVCENECRFATHFDTELFIEHVVNRIGAAPTT